MTPFDKVSAKLTGMKPSGDSGHQWVSCCPAHPDTQASLGIGRTPSNTILLNCYAGCETPDIVAAMGLELRDLYVTREPEDPGITVGRMAFYKRLPVNFLKLCGCRQLPGQSAFEIAYRDESGKELYARLRTSRRAKDGSSYPKGTKPKPYGLWRLPEYRESKIDQLLIVEGESDCWALWYHGFPALGIPGADAVKALELSSVESFPTVIIWKEPDGGGSKFAANMTKNLRILGYSGLILIHATTADAKDPSDIQAKLGHDFKEQFAERLRSNTHPAPEESAASSSGPIQRIPPAVVASGLTSSPFPWNQHLQTDLGNSARIAQLFADDMLYISQWEKWYVWDGCRWKKDALLTVEKNARRTVHGIWWEAQSAPSDTSRLAMETWWRSSQKRSNFTAALAGSKSFLTDTYDSFDRHEFLLACPNGTVNLQTGELIDAERSHRLTMASPVAFDAKAKCPAFDAFLNSIFAREDGSPNDEMIEFIQRLIGYCATGSTREAILPIFWGRGSNGKSTLIKFIIAALGPDYASPSASGFLMEKKNEAHPTEIASLYGKRCVFASETQENKKLDEARVKLLTGGDILQARRMGENFWEFKPTHKLILCTNHKPRIAGDDDGIWRRLAMVPFTSRFWNAQRGETGPDHLKQDPTIETRVLAELPGILAWIVRGAVAFAQDGLHVPDAVRAATAEYREAEDVVGRFLAERTNTIAHRIPKSELYEAFVSWWEAETPARPMSAKSFSQKLLAKNAKEVKSGSTRYWLEIGLNTVDIDD